MYENKNFTGPGAVHRRATYKGCGYDPEDMNRPHIGIASTFNEASPGHAHLGPLIKAIKEGIWQAGGIPFEFGVPSTCGNIAIGSSCLRFEVPVRDAVAASIELVGRIQLFDGVVLTAGCDNIVPGTLLAAARMNIPAIVFTGGPMGAGATKRGPAVLSDANEATFGTVARNAYDEAFVRELERGACPTFGACPVMGTANTMQVLSEALGMTLPGASTIPAVSTEKFVSARRTGRRIVEMVLEDLRPSKILTEAALRNAMRVDMAVGGSTNAVLHILSLARELDLPVTLDDFDRLSRVTPGIVNVRPSGPYTVDMLWEAGGVPAIMKQLQPILEDGAVTVAGKSWKELLEGVEAEPGDMIRSLKEPFCADGGLAVLYGNLSEKGAIVRTSSVRPEMRRFTGPARVFDSDEDAFRAVIGGEIRPGDVIVIRYAGPVGAPGFVEVMLTADALVDLGLDASVGLVTDGRFSGFNYGPIVGHVSPEAALGGVIAYVEEGDLIEVDIPNRALRLKVPNEVLARRMERKIDFKSDVTKGFVRSYAKNCLPADQGAAMQRWD